MQTLGNGHLGPRVAAALIVGALVLTPALAGGKGKAKKAARDGGIDPTNVPVLDDDFSLAMLGGGTDAYDVGTSSRAYYEEEVWERLRAEDAHEEATGRDVLVAVLDAGFNLDHPDLIGHVSSFAYDAVDGDMDPTDFGNGFDDDQDGVTDRGVGHGTFVAGMVLRAAPDATILAVRVRDDEGFGTNAETLLGIEFAVAMGADVINLSLGRTQGDGGLEDAVSWADRQGVLVVVSAGNDGLDSLPLLANHRSTLSVGSVDEEDRVSTFSNYDSRRPAKNLFAPGEDLHGPIGLLHDGSSGTWSGTSFAAGIVSGAAALLLERHPGISPRDARDLLRSAVEEVEDRDGEDLDGCGRIDLREVVRR